jgi:NitT/TauT family transport system substrate-binding protein
MQHCSLFLNAKLQEWCPVNTHFMRRRQLLFAGVGLTVLGTPAWGQSQRTRVPELSMLDIMLDEPDQLRHLPLYLAQSLGFFEQEQLTVRLTHAPVEAQTLEQQASLRTEVFAGSFERVLYMHGNNHANQAFLMLSRTPSVVIGARGQAAAGVQALSHMVELAGLRWGVGPQGGMTHRVALLGLQRAGLRPADVQWTHMPSEAQIVSAFEAQQVDVVALTDLPAAQFERAGHMRVLLDTRTLRDTDWLYGGPAAGVCLSANSAFIDRNQLTIQGATQAVLKAMVWMRTATPTDLMRHVPKALLDSNSAVFFGAWSRSREAFSSDGVFPEGAALNMLKSLHRLQMLPDVSGINPAQTFNNRFAIRSRQLLRA